MIRKTHLTCFVRIFFAGILLICSPVYGEQSPTLLYATRINHDNALGIITASGAVEVSNGQEVLRADKVVFNEKNNSVIAQGNVTLYAKSGDILTSDYIEVTDDLKDGFIQKVYVLTQDNSRLTGSDGIKKGEIAILNHATYTPCDLCAADPTAPPVWQLKAADIERDGEAGDYYYTHARMEFLGSPVFYFPFLSHADPSIKRRSGLLPFAMGYDSRYGFMTGLPYYFALSDSYDYTLLPIMTTEGGVFLDNEYRQRFANGYISINGGVGYTDNRDWGEEKRYSHKKRFWGHLFTKGVFNLTESWRFKFDVNKLDNPQYLKRYHFLDIYNYRTNSVLNSTAEIEGFFGQDYALVKSYWFQDLRPGIKRKQTPWIIPYLYYQKVTPVDRWGGYWTIDLSELLLIREEGTSTTFVQQAEKLAKAKRINRLYGSVAYTIPFFTKDGSVFTVENRVRSSLYSVQSYRPVKGGANYDGSYGRAFPQITLSWKKPYISLMEGGDGLLIEPEMSFVYGGIVTLKRIPNEDSQGFEFSEGNLFASQRLPGIDRIDDGQRINYGATMYYMRDGAFLGKLFLGQSYSFTRFTALPNARQKGVYKGFSDYITKLSFAPTPTLSIESGFMLDRQKLTPKRSQVILSVGPEYLKGNFTYTYAKELFVDEKNDLRRHQLAAGILAKSGRYQVDASLIYDLGKRPGALSYSLGLGYLDECFGMSFSYAKTYFKDNRKPSDSFFLTFSFKNLGTYETGALGAPASYKRHGQLF